MVNRAILRVAIGAALCYSISAQAFTLKDTVFDEVGREVGVDARLLYAVALAESALGKNKGTLGPHPWTLRQSSSLYLDSRKEAEQKLRQLIQKNGPAIDVGMMQINYRWHSDKVSDPVDLLDPKTNVRIAANYLVEMIRSTPGDLELGIGKYHAGPKPLNQGLINARSYGSRVIAIYRNIIALTSTNHD